MWTLSPYYLICSPPLKCRPCPCTCWLRDHSLRTREAPLSPHLLAESGRYMSHPVQGSSPVDDVVVVGEARAARWAVEFSLSHMYKRGGG